MPRMRDRKMTVRCFGAAFLLSVLALTGCIYLSASAQEETEASRNTNAVGADGKKASETEGALTGEIASASEMVTAESVTEDWMVPVTADELKDGTYEIEARSSSSMFRITQCTLTVKDSAMSAAMTMGGTGYRYVFMGTPEEAAEADAKDFIEPEEAEDGTHIFTVPVEALDEAIECAAFSNKKEKWYGRQLCFVAESLPAEALGEALGTARHTEEAGDKAENLADGTYTAEVFLEGGSGRASITSPAGFTVKEGRVTARIEWSSSNYDYMIVDGEKYLPVNEEGNSVFEIPVQVWDRPVKITADTTAMSKPYEIEYMITFDSGTIQEK